MLRGARVLKKFVLGLGFDLVCIPVYHFIGAFFIVFFIYSLQVQMCVSRRSQMDYS